MWFATAIRQGSLCTLLQELHGAAASDASRTCTPSAVPICCCSCGLHRLTPSRSLQQQLGGDCPGHTAAISRALRTRLDRCAL